MSIPHLTLDTNKNLKRMVRVAVRQTEKGGLIEASFLDADSRPYDLTNLHVTFNDRKANNKFLSDSNVTIVDARNGSIKYTLHDQTYAGSGTAWFDISDASGSKVDSTQSFKIEVDDAFNVNIYNSEYVRSLELLRDKMQALVDAAKKLEDDQTNKFTHDLSTNLSNAQNQLNSKLTSMQSAYDSAERQRWGAFNNDQTQRTNTYNADRTNRDNDYKADKARIDQDWVNDKARIDKEWQDDKSRIDGEASTQHTSIQNRADKQNKDIQARADSQNKDIQARADSQNSSIQDRADNQNSTISAAWKKQTDDINAAWTAQKAFLDNAVNSINSTLDTIRKDIDTLSKTSLPAMDQKATEVQSKVDKLRADMSAIDFSSYAKKTEVAVARAIPFPTDITDLDKLPEGRYNPRNLTEDQWQKIKHIPPIDHFGMIICYREDGDGWQLAYSTNNPTIMFFRGAGGGTYADWQQLKQPTTSYTNQDIDNKIAANVPSGPITIGYDIDTKNVTNETNRYDHRWLTDSGTLKTFADAIQALRGSGAHRLSSPVDLNKILGNQMQLSVYNCPNSDNTNTPYFFNDHRGTLIVANYDGNAKTQFWIPVGMPGKNGFAYRYIEGPNFQPWQQIANQVFGNENEDLFAYDSSQVRTYNGNGSSVKNKPTELGNKSWFNVIYKFYPGGWGTAILLSQDQEIYINAKNGTEWGTWQKIPTRSEFEAVKNSSNNALSRAGGNMNLRSTINWNGGNINDKTGNLGGLYWQRGTDNVKIFADQNGNDNLDLVIQLGDDNSNHVSFRNNGGSEVAAIRMDGKYTGRLDWNNIDGKPDVASKSDITNLNSRMNSLDHELTQRVGVLESKMPDIQTVSSEAEGNTYLASHPNAIIFVKG